MSSGERFPKRYTVLRRLGEGGSGHVWLVEDRHRGGMRLALKELARSDADRADNLRLEFATLKQFRHPNLIEVHDLELSTESGLPFFTLEYIEGRDIVSSVRDEGPQLLLELAAEALRSLAFLHDFRLLHRDLKPGNLFVRERPRLGCRLVVLDFGLAMRGGEDSTAGQPAVGTLPYMAPELFRGEPPGPRTDLYSMGAVLFEAVHGRTPVLLRGSEVARFIEAVIEGRRARPALPPGYPAGLTEWLNALLSSDPEQRPATAGEALAQLNAACGTDFPSETSAGRAARLASGAPPGRETEIEALWDALGTVDEPRLVWLEGALGSGRKRFMRWLAGEAVTRGWEVIDSPPALSSDLPEARREVNELLADLRERAYKGPTLVLLEDVDAAGSRVVEFLERVAREGRHAPLRVVASVDPHGVQVPGLRRLLEQTGKVPTLRRIEFAPLGPEGLTALILRATPRRTVSSVKLRWLEQASEGHPLVAEALVVEGAWEKGGRTEKLPRADLSVTRRLELISPAGQRLLRSLAVARTELPELLVASIADLEIGAAREAAAELSAVGLIRVGDAAWSIESRALSKELIERMGSTERSRWHRTAAELIGADKQLASALSFDLARLWSGAGEAKQAVTHATRAAERAESQGDALLAAERYAFALRQMERREPDRLKLRLKQAAMLRKANLAGAAARALGAARFLARDPAQRADIEARQATMLVQSGRFARARAVAEGALELAEKTGNLTAKARAMEAIGIVLARQGHGRESLKFLLETVRAFDSAGERRELAHALQAVGLTEVNEGMPGAREHLTRAIELIEEIGDHGQGLINRVGLAVLEQRAGRYAEAREMLDETRRLAIEQHNTLMEGLTQCTLAQNAIYEERYADAVARSKDSEDHARFLGDDRLLFASRSAQGQALVRCGRVAEATALLESTLAIPRERVDPVMIEYVRLALVEARMAGDNPAADPLREALAQSLRNTRELRDPDTLLWSLTLEMERRSFETRPAVPNELRAEIDTLTAQGGSWDQPLFRARADLAEARVALRREDHPAVVELSERASVTAQATRLYALAAEALELQSTALGLLKRRSEAQEIRIIGRGLLKQAAERIHDSELSRGFEARRIFRGLRDEAGDAGSMDRRLLVLYDMIRALNSESNTRALLESTLDMALEVVGAERGMILLRDPGEESFRVAVARNLERETVEDAQEFSRHVVAQASAGKAVLAIDARSDERFQDLRSVSLFGIHSLICVPLRSRGRVIGTVYLDNRSGSHLFNEGDVEFLEAFANHAALALENARDREWLEQENLRLQAAAEARVRFGNLVGQSPPMLDVFNMIGNIAESELPALIQGESGTGKELVARAIHFNGPRRKRAFVSENCAAIPDSLLQSELFGHVRGAFTGAERDRAGLFEQADGGTLFLDEVGDMSPNMQAQLLRVLEEGKVRRVGDERLIDVDVRVLAATHRDLQARANDGLFREDLMYRLQVLLIRLPPLRERSGDIGLLTEHLLQKVAESRGRSKPMISRAAMEVLEGYAWPGNVRQLENTIQRLSLLAGDGPISREILEQDPSLSQILKTESSPKAPPAKLQKSERDRIRQALGASGGNRSQAARLLGISRATIYRKIKDYEL